MTLLGLGARRRYFCQAQGNPWTHHYHWFMFIQRWIRINYFVICSIQVSELFTLLPVMHEGLFQSVKQVQYLVFVQSQNIFVCASESSEKVDLRRFWLTWPLHSSV